MTATGDPVAYFQLARIRQSLVRAGHTVRASPPSLAMNTPRLVRAAALPAALFSFAVSSLAAPVPVDHHLRSIPANMVSG
jgi:hypothetical protein